ncbi:hypothetical protein NF865_07020 [Thermococcus aggregans]|uniref:Uncharacterized protein n=1 Tax=Thermococcus aggregans TaxID=110163 RepID=A0A9E7MWI1_THEAG|nr:hypothetical protein [Thermococcus aggregans]USS40087.1 hypothetical protein NF865_07020 [Thermococcus aggregans]
MGEHDPIFEKTHPRFKLLFSTGVKPGIAPSRDILWDMRNAILKNSRDIEIFHVGDSLNYNNVKDAISHNPTTFGNLKIWNNVSDSADGIQRFIETVLKKIDDADSRKAKALLELVMYGTISKLLGENKLFNLQFVFDELSNLIYERELKLLFKTKLGSVIFKEGESYIDLKSGKTITKYRSPEKIVNAILDDIRSYISPDPETGILRRLALVYGLDDNYFPSPFKIKNDDITLIQEQLNRNLASEKIQIKIYPVEIDNNGFVFIVAILPSNSILESAPVEEKAGVIFSEDTYW